MYKPLKKAWTLNTTIWNVMYWMSFQLVKMIFPLIHEDTQGTSTDTSPLLINKKRKEEYLIYLLIGFLVVFCCTNSYFFYLELRLLLMTSTSHSIDFNNVHLWFSTTTDTPYVFFLLLILPTCISVKKGLNAWLRLYKM